MNRQIEAAHRVLMIFTPTYRARFEGADTPGGHGVNHEGLVIQQHLYNAKGKNGKFRAVLLGRTTRDCLSVDVEPYTCYQPDDPLGYEDLVRWLYDVQRVTAAPLGKKPGFLTAGPPPGVAKVESVRGISELYRRMRDQLILTTLVSSVLTSAVFSKIHALAVRIGPSRVFHIDGQQQ